MWICGICGKEFDVSTGIRELVEHCYTTHLNPTDQRIARLMITMPYYADRLPSMFRAGDTRYPVG